MAALVCVATVDSGCQVGHRDVIVNAFPSFMMPLRSRALIDKAK